MTEPIEANMKAHSTDFRSDVTVALPEFFLVIHIIIERSSGETGDKLTKEQHRDPSQNQGSWKLL